MPKTLTKQCCNEHSFCVIILTWAAGKQNRSLPCIAVSYCA